MLKQLGLQDVEQTGNCRPAAASAAGGTDREGLLGRWHRADLPEPQGPQPGRRARPGRLPVHRRPRSSAAYQSLTDPANGKPVVERVLTKAQLADVDGSDSLNPTRSGDVVVVTKVPYEFDGNTVGTLVAPSKFFGQHGYLPDDVDLAHNINMHATFVAGGPGHRRTRRRCGVCRRSTWRRRWPSSAASTRRCRPRATCSPSILQGGDRYSTGQLLGINDVHGNLTDDGLTYTDPYTGVKDVAGGIATLSTYLKTGQGHRPARHRHGRGR